jgi:hypothetical protein
VDESNGRKNDDRRRRRKRLLQRRERFHQRSFAFGIVSGKRLSKRRVRGSSKKKKVVDNGHSISYCDSKTRSQESSSHFQRREVK